MPELILEEMSNEFPELLDCFSSDGFDPRRFERFAEHFLRQLDERTDMNPQKVEKEKTRIVSALAQNLYVMCTLSKGQMRAITAFWKAMISFLSPEAGAVARKIRVSYSSCVRQARRQFEETQERHRQMFEDCVHFSIALDTSQFGRDHFVSCVGRFGFEDRICQEILFLEKVTASTGREMASFIFGRLDEKCRDFSKLVSITTDGASNMVSQECGLANEMIKIINEKRMMNLRRGVDVFCLWCLDHRLNLVAKDFVSVENINLVLMFLKWFTANERLVKYARFLRTNHANEKRRKIPPPSETRWLFYRDTLMAVLDQPDLIEAFLNHDGMRDKFVTYLGSSKHPLGALRDVYFSFTHPLVDAHFQFALFVLDILGEINTIFQEKYGFIPNLWEYIWPLDQFLRRELWKIENGDFGRFEFLHQVRRDEIGQFAKILKSLILNLEVRFYDISASLNKKSIKRHLNFDRMVIERGAPIVDRVVCGVLPLLDVFYVKDAFVNAHLAGPLANTGIGGEWGLLMRFVMSNRDTIVGAAEERFGRLSTRERDVRNEIQAPLTPNIIDVFRVFPRNSLPVLWRFVVRVLTIMPTTVACEQSFSYFKRTLHSNMSDVTAQSFIFSRLSLYNRNHEL